MPARKQVRCIMNRAGLRVIYPGKRTSMPSKHHNKYPYLLRAKNIWLPNQVWATDITYIKLAGGHEYLVAIIDVYSRKILSAQISNTLDAYGVRICMDGVNRALDNIYIERFWRTLKYEDIYLNDYRTLTELKAGIKRYMGFYNSERFHASHDYLTPDQMYESKFQKIEIGLLDVA